MSCDAWRHKYIRLYIDNNAAVLMQAVARTVWLMAASYDITLALHLSLKVIHRVSGSGSTHSGEVQVESKLDTILKKIGQLETKNSELEKKFHKQSTIRSASKLSHGSPKRSHKCSTSCSSTQYIKKSSHCVRSQ